MAKLKGAGIEDKKKVAIAGALGLVVLLLAIHTIFGGPGSTTPPPPAPAPQVTTAAPSPSGSGAPASTSAAPVSLDPTLHPEWMAATENYRYTGSGRNIFSLSSAQAVASTPIERVKGPVRPSLETASAPVGTPGPPTINLKFYGYSARKNGMRRAFLMQGENIFVAGEGEVVGHRYKIVRIAPFSIQIEDLPYQDTQTLPLVKN